MRVLYFYHSSTIISFCNILVDLESGCSILYYSIFETAGDIDVTFINIMIGQKSLRIDWKVTVVSKKA